MVTRPTSSSSANATWSWLPTINSWWTWLVVHSLSLTTTRSLRATRPSTRRSYAVCRYRRDSQQAVHGLQGGHCRPHCDPKPVHPGGRLRVPDLQVAVHHHLQDRQEGGDSLSLCRHRASYHGRHKVWERKGRIKKGDGLVTTNVPL